MKETRAEFGCALWGTSVCVVGGFVKNNFSSTTGEYRNLDNNGTWTIIFKSDFFGHVLDQISLAGIICLIEKKCTHFMTVRFTVSPSTSKNFPAT